MVLPMADEEPMNPAYLVEAGELDDAFAGWKVIRSAVREKPGSRRVYEFLAQRR